MRNLILASLLICSACGPAREPLATRIVAAVEVPVATPRDRGDFLAILRRDAAAHGFHVDTATPAELAKANAVSPITVNAAVWRGSTDEEIAASAMDGAGHVGRVWLSFAHGRDPRVSAAFRADVWRDLRRRWPAALTLPILPTGALPLPGDLVRTPDGYRLKPAAATKSRG